MGKLCIVCNQIPARVNGLCHKHGGKHKCSYKNCPNDARRSGGYCRTHDTEKTDVKYCKIKDCKNQVKKNNLCDKHYLEIYPDYRKICDEKNCTKLSRKNGKCFKHGDKEKCIIKDCPNLASYNKKCVSHNPKSRCEINGCKAQARYLKRCFKHSEDQEWRKKFITKCTLYCLKRYSTDIKYKLKKNLQRRIIHAIKGETKSKSTMKLIGCTINELMESLQKKFTKGMSWNNYGEWQIDHIIPCSSFNLIETNEQEKCFNYKNLQPLWKKDNLEKSNKLDWIKQEEINIELAKKELQSSKKDLESKTVKQLKNLCKENGITGYSNKNKQELISLLN